MLFPVVALLAIVDLAFSAAPAAQSTYCYEDNLLRAFQHTPTPAASYCKTATGYPAFLAVTSYPATRLSSACSCFSRFPTEPTATKTTTTSAPCPSPTRFVYYRNYNGDVINMVVTIDRTKPCGTTGYLVIGVCGTYSGLPITFNPNDVVTQAYGTSDNCYYPDTPEFVLDLSGYTFRVNGRQYSFYLDIADEPNFYAYYNVDIGAGLGYYDLPFTPVTCSSTPPIC